MHSYRRLDELVCFSGDGTASNPAAPSRKEGAADRFPLGHIGLSYTAKQLIAREVCVLLIYTIALIRWISCKFSLHNLYSTIYSSTIHTVHKYLPRPVYFTPACVQ